jgi:hypothetical protein
VLSISQTLRRRRQTARTAALAASVAGLALASLATASAQADVVSTSACDGAQLTQAFARWNDPELYKVAPGGNFRGTLAGWSLLGGPQLVLGAEPYAVSGTLGTYSLSVPESASAQSPYTCVNAAYPTFRFFARSSTPNSTLLVQAVYQDVTGSPVEIPVGTVTLSTSWQPTVPMLTGSAIPGAMNGGTAQVALRFTSQSGTTQIDDVYVDPRMT